MPANYSNVLVLSLTNIFVNRALRVLLALKVLLVVLELL